MPADRLARSFCNLFHAREIPVVEIDEAAVEQGDDLSALFADHDLRVAQRVIFEKALPLANDGKDGGWLILHPIRARKAEKFGPDRARSAPQEGKDLLIPFQRGDQICAETAHEPSRVAGRVRDTLSRDARRAVEDESRALVRIDRILAIFFFRTGDIGQDPAHALLLQRSLLLTDSTATAPPRTASMRER